MSISPKKASESEGRSPTINIRTYEEPQEYESPGQDKEEQDSYYQKYNLDRWDHLYQKDVRLKLKREEEAK